MNRFYSDAKGEPTMQYRKLSHPARAYANELFEEYRKHVRENLPADRAAEIRFCPDISTVGCVRELQSFFHFKVRKDKIIINQFFVDHMTCLCKW